MREFGRVQTSLWGHPDFQGLSRDGRLGCLFVLLGPHHNGIGCYRLPAAYMAADLCMEPSEVESVLEELVGAGWIERCTATGYVRVPGFLRYQPPANPNVTQHRVDEFDAIPGSCALRAGVAADLLEQGKHLSDEARTRLVEIRNAAQRWTPPEVRSETVQETVQETVPETVPECSPKPADNPSETGEERRGEERESRGEEGAELDLALSAPESPDEIVTRIALNGGAMHAVTTVDRDRWAATYPLVDVDQALRRIASWYDANPRRRCTPNGIRRAIDQWLARDQDAAARRASGQQGGAPPEPHHTRSNRGALEQFTGRGSR